MTSDGNCQTPSRDGTIAASTSLTRKETIGIILETNDTINPAIRPKPAKSLPSIKDWQGTLVTYVATFTNCGTYRVGECGDINNQQGTVLLCGLLFIDTKEFDVCPLTSIGVPRILPIREFQEDAVSQFLQ
jgi:hypothetical protein